MLARAAKRMAPSVRRLPRDHVRLEGVGTGFNRRAPTQNRLDARQEATMTQTAPNGADDLDETARKRIIRREIQQLGDGARERHPWLAHQDAIGAGLLLVSAAAILANAGLYGAGRLSAWLVLPLSAFFMSILHELEHDLLHRLYF